MREGKLGEGTIVADLMYGVRALCREKEKGGKKAGTMTSCHALQFVKPTNIVNIST
jgi:hypothetical protein